MNDSLADELQWWVAGLPVSTLLTLPDGLMLRIDLALRTRQPADIIGEAQIKQMAQRFLGWKLPPDFNPDAGISFRPEFNEHTAHPMRHEPIGTNLFSATQAEVMVRYMADVECATCVGTGSIQTTNDGPPTFGFAPCPDCQPTDTAAVERVALDALGWYAEQVAGCRKLGSIGDPARHALDADGGKRAQAAIAAMTEEQ